MAPTWRTSQLATLLLLAGGFISISSADTLLGCFKEGTRTVLPTQALLAVQLEPEACSAAARARGQAYYGLTRGNECWIGTNSAVVLGPSTECNTPCAGDAAQTCGGANAISLYQVTDTAPAAASSDTTPTLQGCYADGEGGDRRMTPLWSDDRMTADFCALLAKHEGFKVFGLKWHRECWGSNDLTYATALGTSTACTASCMGDASEKCGGSNALSIYTLPDFTKLGCYKDSWDRMLPECLQTFGLMTPARCAQLAVDGGYTVFGLQNSVECWAGTDVTRAKSLGISTECTERCTSALTGDCGGTLANTVYTVGSSKPAPAPAAARGFAFEGCYRDNIADRGLPMLLETDVGMTVDRCARLVQKAGYSVFGVQWAQSCYAGADEAAAKKHGAADNCNSPCWLHTQDSCGGALATSLYKMTTPPPVSPPPVSPPPIITPPVSPPPVVTPPDSPPPVVTPPVDPPPYIPPGPADGGGASDIDITYLGCYGDEVGVCALSVVLRASPDMTVDECARLAFESRAAYTVFGIQYASECYAGMSEANAVRYGPSQACNMACHGTDPAGSCGGPLANSVYRLPPKPPASPRPHPSPIPGLEYTPQGCWADDTTRAVNILLGGDPATMTTAECARRAKERYLTVFALQYGGECFGSDDLEASERLGALPDDRCYMPCGGATDEVCGGPGANSLYTLPPPGPPEDVPPYTSVGCFTDDQVFDDSHTPPSPTQRRMWRRLGQAIGLDSWECAKRALAAGYPLFGVTSGETFPAYGWQCWGAYDEAYVTALGPSTGCTNACKDYRGADRCGGEFAISLYRLTGVQYDTGAGGRFEFKMEFPVSAVHIMQVTGRDEFLLIDFLGGNHPPSWDGRNTTYMWVRANNTARSILNIRDASCGMWIRLPEGDFAGFSGYFGASGVNEYSIWATMLYHRYQHRAEDFGDRAMPYGRWYGGAMLLPDGMAYVTGGDMNGPGSQRALGADIWDPAHKSYVGRANNMGQNEPYLPLSDPLFFASEVAGYYPGLWPLYSGGLLFAQSQTVQVINPATGAALAAAPPLPRNNYWEYPLSGSQVLLREPIINPNDDTTLYFMVFGGGYQAAFYKPCSDFSLRIRLDVRCSTRPCTHTFGEWEVETMPGHRCMLDTAVLPNGKVMILGGTEEGLSNLDHRPNSCNVPVNEPWIYDPEAPAGRRYRRTGAYTNIARVYHGSHLMTSYGDILLGGSTIAEGFTSYHMRDFDVTPYQWAEYRIELFKPHYILGPRPAWATVPTQVEFASTFTVTLAANSTVSDIVAVVLKDAGTTTHSSNMAMRCMQLAFAPAGGQALTVTAPANIHIAQPGFYMLFAVSSDDSFSVGSWLRLKGPWGSRPSSLPTPAQFVTSASSQFEANFVPWTVNPSGSADVALTRTAAAAGSGAFGLRVAAGGNQPIVLAGPALALTAGTRVHTYLWARGPSDDAVQMQYMLLDAGNMPAASYPLDAYADIRVTLMSTYQHYTLGGLVVNNTGNYYPALRITGMTAGQAVSLDDIEVFTLTQADAAASLQQVRAGTPVGEQIAPRAAAAKRKARRLHATAATPAQGAWAQQPEVQDTNLELQQQLERELKVKLHTGQHASSALAGVKVEGMKHKHVVQDAGEGGHDMGHQM